VTCRPTDTDQLGKQACNKYTTNNRGHPVLGNRCVSYRSASRLYKWHGTESNQREYENGVSPQRSRKKGLAADL
jgi:hypothetical protein